jgi:hypothetical protein
MKAYNPRHPLISLHVPKCGGSSFRDVLGKWFGTNYYLHYIDEATNQLPPQRRLRRPKLRFLYRQRLCIHGHFNRNRGLGVEDYYPNVNQFITILRDPFEVAVSRYFYAKRFGEKRVLAGRNQPIAAKFASINDFLEAHMNVEFFAAYMPRPVTIDNYEAIFEKYFVYVGIMEDYQTTIDVLARKLGQPTVQVPVKNVSARDEEILPSLRDDYVANHPLEYAMYDYACRHYRTG